MPFLIGNEFHFYLEKTRQSCQQNYAYNFIKYSGLPAKDRHPPEGAPAFFPRRTPFSPFHGRMASTRKAGGRDIVGEAACRTGGKAGQDARCPPARRPGWPDASPGGAPCGLLPGSGFTAAGSLSPGRGGPRQAVIRPPAGGPPPGRSCPACVVLPGAACRCVPVPTAGDPARAGRWPRPHGRERWRPCRPGPRWCGPGAAPGCRHGRKGPGRARPVP